MSKKLDKVAAKKLELENSIQRIQSQLDHNIGSVKGEVVQTVHPGELIKKYPLQLVGAAVVLGFWLGTSGKSSSKSVKISNNSLADSIGSSIKKRLSRKAVDLALDFVEGKLSEPRKGSEL